MSIFFHHLLLALPLFLLILVGFAVMHWGKWPRAVSDSLTRFVFAIALPALLFHMMSQLSTMPPVDARLLIAFFGGCFLVFAGARLLAAKVFKLDGVSQSMFALGGVFSNNVLLGIPLAKSTLGDAALPAVAMVLVFNALTLWTLATVSVEWARHGSFTLHGFSKTARSVVTNPIVAAILSGTAFGLTGLSLPNVIEQPLSMIAEAATPMALIALGMGLAQYGLRSDLKVSMAISAMKLVAHPLAVFGIARVVGLPRLETQVVVLLASIAVGANVYLMSRQFNSMEGPVASSLVLSTALAAFTVPISIALAGAYA